MVIDAGIETRSLKVEARSSFEHPASSIDTSIYNIKLASMSCWEQTYNIMGYEAAVNKAWNELAGFN